MPKKKPVWAPGDPPTSELARLIINGYYNDRFYLIVIYGDPRIGKTIYGLKVLFQVYDFIWGWEPERVLEEMVGWKPEEVIQDWRNFKRKIPSYIWDDAGCWLFTLDWHDPLLKEIQRYFNVVATNIQVPILTTPDPRWVLSKIGKMPGSKWIKIIRTQGDRRYLGPLPDGVRFARRALTYTPWVAPDLKKTGVSKPDVQDDFSCKLDQDLYDVYQPRREFYANLVQERMWGAMKEKMKEEEAGGKALFGEAVNRELDALK